MHTEEVAEKEGQVLDELLITGVTLRVCRFQVHCQGDEVGDSGQDFSKHLHELLVIVVRLARAAGLQTSDLGQALEGHIPELRNLEKTSSQGIDQRCLENVSQRDPVTKPQQRLQGSLDKAREGRRVEDFLAEVENLRELVAHRRLEVARLGRGHLLGGVVKYLLGKKAKNRHIVLAH